MPGFRKLCWRPGAQRAWDEAQLTWRLEVVEVNGACAVTVNGSLACGGDSSSSGTGGGAIVVMGEFVAAAPSGGVSVCALRSNGSFTCFNTSDMAPLPHPAGAPTAPLQQLVCDGGGSVHDDAALCCGVLSVDGSCVCWRPSPAGASFDVMSKPGPYALISTGGGTTCGLARETRLPECWSSYGNVPIVAPGASPLTALASLSVGGATLICGLALADSSLVCWNEVPVEQMSGDGPAVTLSGALSAVAAAPGFVCAQFASSGVIACAGAPVPPPRLACPAPSSDRPGHCVLVVANALDAGLAPGIGANDTVTVQFSTDISQACDTVAGSTAAVDALLRFSSPLGGSYTALWATSELLVVTVLGGGADVDRTRIGALNVTLNQGSCFGAAAAINVAGVAFSVGGSWGPWPAPRLLAAVAADSGGAPGPGLSDTVLLTFDMEVDRARDVGVEWSAPALMVSTKYQWIDARTLKAILYGAPASDDSAATSIGVLRAGCGSVGGGIVSRDLSSPPCATAGAAAGGKMVNVTGGWGNSIAAVSGGGSLRTGGGDTVTLALSAAIGAGHERDPVRAVYSNGAHAYTARGCVVARSDGAAVICTSAPGVGAGLVWTLWGAGLDNASSSSFSAYATPKLNGVSPFEVGTAGGEIMSFVGVELGSRSEDLGPVEFRPVGSSAEVYYAHNCSITTNNTGVSCIAPPLRGAIVRVTLNVGQQSSTNAALATAPPVIHNVSLTKWDARCGDNATLCTAGGDRVRLMGGNFGARSDGLIVTYSGLVASKCVVVTRHMVIECLTVRGTGAGLRWSVSVLGSTSAALAGALSYAPPRVFNMTGSFAARGFSATATCVNCAEAPVFARFGGAARYPGTVVVSSGPSPAAGAATLIAFLVPPSAGSPRATMVLEMAGAVSNPYTFTYARPVVSAIDILAVGAAPGGGGTVYTLALLGANFVAGATNVTIDGSPAALGGGGIGAAAAVTDGSVTCTTRASAGALRVLVGGQASAPLPYNASAPQSVPLVTGVAPSPGAGGPPRLATGGWVTLTGAALRASLPGVTRVVRAPFADCATAPPACLNATVTLSSISCFLPPSPLGRVVVAVVKIAGRECVASAPMPIDYAPPLVWGLTPAVVDPAGGDLLYIAGDNFEGGTTVSVGGARCGVVASNASCIVCATPPGVGARADVAISSATWGDAPPCGGLARSPPEVTGVAPALLPARGSLVTLSGRHFGGSPVVTLDDVPLTSVAAAVGAGGVNVTVRVPPGVGVGHVASVHAGDQTGRAHLAYAAPRLTGASVPWVDAATGGTLTLTGENFGPPGTPLTVMVGGVRCAPASVLDDARAQCVVAVASTVVAFDAAVTLTVGGQTAAAALRLPVACPPGMFGGEGERCRACPEHAVCYGGRFEPLPTSGFYRAGRTAFAACTPPSACVALPAPTPEQLLSVEPDSPWAAVAPAAGGGGGNASAPATAYNCAAPAYTGFACSLCGGGYYRVNTPCIACPSHATAIFGLYAALLVAGVGVLQWAYRRRAMLKGLTVGIDFLQVMNMFQGFKFRWPPAVRSVFSFANFFAFNFSEQAAPECTIRLTFFHKWLALQLVPAAIIAILIVTYGGVILLALVQAGRAARAPAPPDEAPAAASDRAARLRSRIGRQYDLAVGSCLTVMCECYALAGALPYRAATLPPHSLHGFAD
jgi:hypothetical protein